MACARSAHQDLAEALERIRQLQNLLIPAQTLPAILCLSRMQTKITLYLLARSPGFVSTKQIANAVYFDDVDGGPSSNSLSILVWRTRKRLALHGIFIENKQGFGFRMPSESAAVLRRMIGGLS